MKRDINNIGFQVSFFIITHKKEKNQKSIGRDLVPSSVAHPYKKYWAALKIGVLMRLVYLD